MLDIVPYDYRPARFQVPTMKGYWVTLYLIYDGQTTYTFYHQTEWLDNIALIHELDKSNVDCFKKEIIVTASSFPRIFNAIEEYEKHVSQSYSN